MDPGLRLKLKPERRLAMTFALRQALEILQMPRIEFAQWLSQEIEKNPLLQGIGSSSFTLPLEKIEAPVSLYDHLMSQIREIFPLDSHRRMAEDLLEHLDEKGFLSTPVAEIATHLQISVHTLTPILSTLQTFDPPGIFARNLQEALLLQLKARGDTAEPSFYLIRDCFEDLTHGRYAAIKKKMGEINLSAAIRKLARLQLRPADAFKREAVPLALADLRISQTEEGWTVEPCFDDLPKFEICTEYESLAPQSPEEQESLRSWSAAAKWLTRSLKRRNQILVQIGAFLVKKQSTYLSQKGNLKPLSLQDLSKELHLHESTLSRALSGKYAETPRGLIPLRSLLIHSPSTDGAKELLSQLVLKEDKTKPLTDEELSLALSSKGYKAARRTIAKYRSELKVGSASARKHII